MKGATLLCPAGSDGFVGLLRAVKNLGLPMEDNSPYSAQAIGPGGNRLTFFNEPGNLSDRWLPEEIKSLECLDIESYVAYDIECRSALLFCRVVRECATLIAGALVLDGDYVISKASEIEPDIVRL